MRARLREDLGLDPSPELVELNRQLLSHDDALAAPTPMTGPRHNLPEYVSTFVGREQEFGDLNAALSRSRLVTVTGPGGAGKTRLAVASAATVLTRFPDGVWLADLAPVSTISEVISTIATVAGVRADVNTVALADALRARRTLLVLDNCEHIIDDIADLTALLLRRCPTLRVLATSREPLGVDGERVYRIPALQVPDLDTVDCETLRGCDAVRLFADRASLFQQHFTLDDQATMVAATICRRVDGLPLGIELAAARLAVLSLTEIDRCLDHRLALLTGGGRRVLGRQQTLRALIDWSYDLLEPDEQRVLATLSVFVGSFDVDAVEAVTTGAGLADFESPPVFDVVAGLVTKSLVETVPSDNPRFRLLETVREYATEKFAARGDAVNVFRRTHAAYYTDLATRAGYDLEHGQNQPVWLERIDADYDNLRAAWNYLLDHDAIAAGLAMCIGLRRFWIIRGLAGKAVPAIMTFIERVQPDEDRHLVGMAFATAASLSWALGNLDDATTFSHRATEGSAGGDLEVLAVAGRIGAMVLVARGQPTEGAQALAALLDQDVPEYARRTLEGALGFALLSAERLPAARDALRRQMAGLRDEGDLDLLAEGLLNLATVEMTEGNEQAAREAIVEGLEIANLLGEQGTVGWAMGNLALLELSSGDISAARSLYSSALDRLHSFDEPIVKIFVVNGLTLCAQPGGPSAATLVRLHGAIDALSQAHGLLFDRTERELSDTQRQHLSIHLGATEYERLSRQGRTLTLLEAVAIAQSLPAEP